MYGMGRWERDGYMYDGLGYEVYVCLLIICDVSRRYFACFVVLCV